MSSTTPSSEPPERAGLILEYGMLREEILKRVDVRHQVTSICLTLAGVFLGVALADGGENASIALVYPVLAALLAMAWSQNEARVRAAATYIRERIEPRVPGLAWEASRESERRARGDRTWLLAVLSHGGVFLCTQALAIAVGVIHSSWGPTDWLLVSADGLAVVYVVISMVRSAHP